MAPGVDCAPVPANRRSQRFGSAALVKARRMASARQFGARPFAYNTLQRPTPSDFGPNASHASHCSDEHVARGHRGRLKIRKAQCARAFRRAT